MLGLGSLCLSLGVSRSGSGVAIAPIIAYSSPTFSNSLGTAGQWYRNGVAISGQTGATYTYNDTNDRNTWITQKLGALESNAIIVGRDNLAYTTSWVGARANLSTFESWTTVAGTNILRDGSGLLVQADNAAFQPYSRSVGSAAQEIIVHSTAIATPSNANTRILRACFTDEDNRIDFNFQAGPSGSWTIYKIIAGVGTLVDSNSGINIVTGDEVRIKTIPVGSDVYAMYWIGGVRADSGGSGGLLISGMPSGSSIGIVDGANHDGALPSGDIPLLQDMTVYARPSSWITITAATASAPDLANGHPYPTLRVQGIYTSSTTHMKVGIADSSNGRLVDFSTPSAVTGGTFDITVPVSNAMAQGTTVNVWAVDSDDHSIGDVFAQSLSYYAPLAAIQFGMNASEWRNYGLADVVRDRGLIANIFQLNTGTSATTAVTSFTAAGWPSGTLTGGYDAFGCLIWEVTTSQQSGAHTVHFPAGMTASWGALTNATAGTINSAAGTAQITIGDTTSSTNAQLTLSGTPTAGFGTTGLVISCYPDADVNTSRPVTDNFKTDYGLIGSGLKVLRFMKASGMEGSGEFYTAPRFYTPEFIAATCNLLNVSPWITIAANSTDAEVLDFAQRLFANLNSGIVVYVEKSNEIWNTFYAKQFAWYGWSAANAGLVSGVTGGSVINGVTYDSSGNYTGASDQGSGVTNRTFATNDVIYGAGAGYQAVVVKALGNTSIGATIPGTVDNADFTILAVYGAIYPAILKQQSRKQVATGNIFKGVFGNTRAKSILGIWLSDPSAVANTTLQLAFESAWQYLDGYAPSGYIGAGITYNPAGVSWHADHSLNQSNFITQYRAGVVTDAGITIATLQTIKSGVETYMRTTLAVPVGTAVPQMHIYEAGNHDLFYDSTTRVDGSTPGITGTIATTVLTVTAIADATNYPIKKGMEIKNAGSGASYGYVSSFGTGTGGTGTYNLTASNTIASTAMVGSITTAMTAALAAVKQAAGYGSDLTTYYYTPLVNKIGGPQAHFQDYEAFAVANGGQIQLFGTLSQSQGGRTNERVWSAITTSALANP